MEEVNRSKKEVVPPEGLNSISLGNNLFFFSFTLSVNLCRLAVIRT